ncbi:MAG: pseudouridine-5'-phosphate glycosidase, partial [Pseudomonadota bacterium]
MSDISALFDIAREVREAQAQNQPIVALESTVIAHGLPRPINHETALAVQKLIRDKGAVPATIAVMDGRIKIGLDDTDLARFASQTQVRKLSTKDIAIALTTGEMGATTVAATMQIAALAGIAVFATGGIGGVHRGAEHSFDESADLPALARYPVAVVTAGAKSILDLPKTLERLESLSVPVIGYGCDDFPAFYLSESGLAVDQRFDELADIARFLALKWQLDGGQGGAVIANPIPAALALDKTTHDGALTQALADVAAAGIT